MHKIVLLGDSLGMPRPSENVFYENTYPYLLARKVSGCDVISRFSRARDTRLQSSEQQICDDILWLQPDMLVMHLGIVDCAPRLFKPIERRIISIVPPFMRNGVIHFFSKNRSFFTKHRNIVYVEKDEFARNVWRVCRAAQQTGSKVIILGIIMPPVSVLNRSYGFDDNVNEYNKILFNASKEFQFEFADVNKIISNDSDLCDDGIHLNKYGNELLASYLLEVIQNCF
ncbi:SGNH/GDSL hydrolase family protein [Mariprofundus erugo]|uniref:SGNH/GDSL hydrolase family protein n=1 Tax=Mariprofundus erugo TaxID=2528639 RepID=A0A5R9GP95_9PROT|nr:SGNH/GDSL hydrolase family protein [Mariprofundus erugo]TLS66739.1 SGNH/GDSL hydrolase family protein [Mariprofundus erugo]